MHFGMEKSSLNGSKFKELRWFTGLCTGWLQTILVLNLKGEKSHITLGTLRINSMFHCRAQTITKIVSAIVAPFSGTVSPVT